MATASDALRKQAVELHDPKRRAVPPWERLQRVQQQVLTCLLTRMLSDLSARGESTPSDVVEWYGVSRRLCEWLDRWRKEGFVLPAKEGARRVRRYTLSSEWASHCRCQLTQDVRQPNSWIILNGAFDRVYFNI